MLTEDFRYSDFDFVEAAFDRPANRLYLLTHDHSSPNYPTRLTKYTAGGLPLRLGSDLAGFLFDTVGGALIENFLDVEIGSGGTGGSTIVRVDRVAVYDGDVLLWESCMMDRQEYSTDGPMSYVIPGAHAEDIHHAELKAYVTVMNENYSPGPLYSMDTFRFVWHYKDGRFRLNKDNTAQNPADCPSWD